MEIGSALEDYTSAKAKKDIQKLIQLMPKMARVRRNVIEESIPVGQIQIDDTIIVLAGETIPTDGTITKGTTAIDQSTMTGESLPVDKTVGDNVISGTINTQGVFEYSATAEVSIIFLQLSNVPLLSLLLSAPVPLSWQHRPQLWPASEMRQSMA